MALTEEREKSIWLTAQNGKFLKQVEKDTPGAVHRVAKGGKDVYEVRYEAIEGLITSLKIQEPPADKPEYGQSLIVFMADKEERYAVRIPLSSSYAFGFLNRLTNIDPLKYVQLNIFDKPREDDPEKKQRVLFIRQNGTTLPGIWSRENKQEGTENELPDLVCLKAATKNSKAKWDDSARVEFLAEFAIRHGAKFKSNLKPIAKEPALAEPEIEEYEEEDTDDLPF